MLTRILAASALTLGLAAGAMAQTANSTSGSGGSGQSVTIEPKTPATTPDQQAPDTATTGSTTTGDMNSNADKNCPNSPQGAQGDANSTTAGTMAPNVNDKNCGN